MELEQATEAIIKSAKKEFQAHGYEKASLRTIAKNAGVTTGSLYARFPNKDALFCALVEPITGKMLSLFDEDGIKSYANIDIDSVWNDSRAMMLGIVDYIYENKEAFDLLINCSNGSSQEFFIDKLIEKEEEQMSIFIPRLIEAGVNCKNLSRYEVHTLVSANYYAMFESIRHDTSKEQAIKQITVVADFFKSGWSAMLGI